MFHRFAIVAVLVALAIALLPAADARAQTYPIPVEPLGDGAVMDPPSGWHAVAAIRIGDLFYPDTWSTAYHYSETVNWADDGTADLAHVTSAACAMDANGNGIWEPATEPVLEANIVDIDTGERSFDLRYPWVISESDAVINLTGNPTLFILYQLAAGTPPVGTYQVVFERQSQRHGQWDLWMTPNWAFHTGGAGNFEFESDVSCPPAQFRHLAVSATAAAPDADVAPGATNATLAAFDLVPFTTDPFELDAVTVQRVEGEPARVHSLRLALDTDGNGLFEAGLDVLLDTADLPLEASDEVTFDLTALIGQPLLVADARTLLVVADMDAVLPEGMRFSFELTGGTLANADDGLLAGLPVAGRVLTARQVREPRVAVAGAGQDRNVEAGSDHEVVATLVLDTIDANLNLLGVAIAPLGDLNESSHINEVNLVADTNGNGRIDLGPDGNDAWLGGGSFSADNAPMTISVNGLALAAGGRTTLLIGYSLGVSAPDGAMAGLRVTALVTSDSSIAVEGLPLDSPALVIGNGLLGGGDDDDDAEFDPEPEIPAALTSGAGSALACQAAGRADVAAVLLALLLLGGLVVIRRRA